MDFEPSFYKQGLFVRLAASKNAPLEPSTIVRRTLSPSCKSKLSKALPPDLLQGLGLVLHRNGEPDPCGSLPADMTLFEDALVSFDVCLDSFDKYAFESWLTRVMNHVSGCESTISKKTIAPGFLGYCDRDPPTLQSCPTTTSSSGYPQPTRFHVTFILVRVSVLPVLSNSGFVDCFQGSSNLLPGDENCGDRPSVASLHLYAVNAGRVFMFAPKFIGEIFELPHVTGDKGAPISLKVLSTEPRVFDIFNFFSRDESTDLVNRALKETTESHRIKRSTTGAQGHAVNSRRTSESGFDTHGKVAVDVKKRCFKILGFDEYIEGHGDGLQILRYNLTTAYIPHMDWIDDPSGTLQHDYDSAGRGGNRFSTILMYMSDLGPDAGGETVFTEAWPVDLPEDQRVDLKTALESLRKSKDAVGILEPGSWEEEMVAQCRSRLAIRPHAGRAVLFYSQLPSGEPDPASRHGGCPVLKGEKYASNLWVWNTIRDGFEGAPRNPKAKQTASSPTQSEKKVVTFSNVGGDPTYDNAELFYGDEMFWSKLGKGSPSVSVNTYPGHVWNLKVRGEVVKTWTIKADDPTINFEI
ncbi:prolyl 4-hydroxylase alpha-subunit [Fragilaria crotonensis]|nr:prolyl 4-hydroxylase alpha-subunit [Fragilaria crotonensis]